MGDNDLDAIRQRRMAELMAQQGGAPGAEDQQATAAQRAQEDEQRMAMLAAILLPQARERLARIRLVKPEKARAIEEMIIGAARQGALREKVTEERLIELLEQVNERAEKKTTVTIQRRRRAFDDDSDDDYM